MKRLIMVPPLLLLGGAMPQSSPIERLPNDSAGRIVRRAIEHSGGWNAWAAKKTVEFRKTIRRFRPDGSLGRTLVQSHRYRLAPEFGVRIDWEENGKKSAVVNNGRFAAKVAGGAEDFSVDAAREARNETFGSQYLFGMPFKLTDAGAHLEDLGRATLGDGTLADRVRVTYEKGVGDAGGLHTWTYYFDSRNGRLLAAHRNYEPDRYDFMEYFDEKAFDGIQLATKRRTYGAGAEGKTGPLLSEEIYEDIRFGVGLEDSIFAIPPR